MKTKEKDSLSALIERTLEPVGPDDPMGERRDELAFIAPTLARGLRDLTEACEPFFGLGLAFTQDGELDDSPWAVTPDDHAVVKWGACAITVKDFRRLAALLQGMKGETK